MRAGFVELLNFHLSSFASFVTFRQFHRLSPVSSPFASFITFRQFRHFKFFLVKLKLSPSVKPPNFA
jgi:hypothetical protein